MFLHAFKCEQQLSTTFDLKSFSMLINVNSFYMFRSVDNLTKNLHIFLIDVEKHVQIAYLLWGIT